MVGEPSGASSATGRRQVGIFVLDTSARSQRRGGGMPFRSAAKTVSGRRIGRAHFHALRL